MYATPARNIIPMRENERDSTYIYTAVSGPGAREDGREGGKEAPNIGRETRTVEEGRPR